MAVVLVVLSAGVGIGLCQLQPSGRNVGLIQFDVVSEWSQDVLKGGNIVVFARYWVCQDYYAFSVIWTEPHGHGVRMMTSRLLSDGTGFRTDTELFPDSAVVNMTYPKPFGERPAFRWRGGFYGGMEERFAEAEALATRVYVSDLAPAVGRKSGADSVMDITVPKGSGDVARKVARLKVRAKDDRVDWVELFDKQGLSLGAMRYEYEQGAGPARLATLVAELPAKPIKLAIRSDAAVSNPDGTRTPVKIPDADYLYHKGGRTCTVTYKDVALGDTVLRLPVEVKVRRTDTKQLVRSARFMNYKRVDLDKEGVWEAAGAFGGLDREYRTWLAFRAKFLEHEARLGPPSVDANDPNVARRLLAKYPVWEEPRPPGMNASASETGLPRRLKSAETHDDWQETIQDWKREQEKEQEQLKKWREEVARMPRPPREQVEPNDVRLIRQLRTCYRKRFSTIQGQVPQDELELWRLSRKLPDILRYHRVAQLPEDQAPEPNECDIKQIQDLKEHYEKLAVQDDKGLPGRLKAIDALARLDLIVKDYNALEGHATRYLQMLRDGGLNEMYLAGGHRHMERFVEAGRYEHAKRLLGPWADSSAAVNDANGVYRFCRSYHGEADPWANLQVLDHFLKRPGLSPVQRYEGLALRAIALDKIDTMLADPDVAEDEAGAAQVQWILKNTTRAEIARLVGPAVRQAVSAWEALGPARMTIARPYSTESMDPDAQNIMEAPSATQLQETSAKLDRIVSRRFGRQGPAPRPRETQQPAPRPRETRKPAPRR